MITRLLLALSLLIAVSPAIAEQERLAGKELTVALKALANQYDVQFLYSSDLVHSGMLVTEEPISGDLMLRLTDLLDDFRLTAKVTAGRRIVILRDKTRTDSDTGIIRGTVKDKDGYPVSGVRVNVVGGFGSGVTGKQGYYAIPQVQPGEHRLQTWSRGHETATSESFPLSAGDSRWIFFNLEDGPYQLDRIEIAPSRIALLTDTASSSYTLSREEIDRLPHAADDLNRAVATVPGVATNETTAFINTRGGSPDETMIVIDGMEIFDPFHLKSLNSPLSAIDSNIIGGLEFMSGAYPAKFGNHLSGVMDASSVTPSGATTNTLGASFINAFFTNQGNFNKGDGGWLFSVRRGYLDIALEFIDSNSAINPEFYDSFAKVEKAVGERNNWYLDFFGYDSVLDAFDQTGPDLDRVDSRQNAVFVWSGLQTDWSPRFFSDSMISAGRFMSREDGTSRDQGDEDVIFNDRRETTLLGLKQDWRLDISSKILFESGASVRRFSTDYNHDSNGTIFNTFFLGGGPPVTFQQTALFDREGTEYSAYVSTRVQPVTPLTLEIGYRWDRQTWLDLDDDSHTSPRLSGAWKLASNSTFRFAWGRFYQAQNSHELQVEDGINSFFPADRATHYILGFDQQIGNAFDLRAEIYRKNYDQQRPRFQNLYDPNNLFPATRADRLRFDPTDGRAEGVELSLRFDRGGSTNWWLYYGYSRADDLVSNRRQKRPWDQTNTVRFNWNREFSNGWVFNVLGDYHTGHPTTEITGRAETQPDGSVNIVGQLGQPYADNYPDYLSVSIRTSRTKALKRGSFTYFFEVFNVFDHHNVTCSETDGFRGNLKPNGSVEVTREDDCFIPFLPSFGVLWEF